MTTPTPATLECPLCHDPEVGVRRNGRFNDHRRHDQPRRPCPASNLLPADVA